MPLFEFKCKTCGHEFEEITKSDIINFPCPKCDGESERMLSVSYFHLKGGGWYKDGYCSSGGVCNSCPNKKENK